ncbi:MAG: 5-methyltetrahydropteroyltriglutamate--homocysteine S-methyltransferase [Carbonactinosporaceae bacterium]
MTNERNRATGSGAAIGATVLGYPRIGRRRELKRVLESYWSGEASIDDVRAVSAQVRDDALRTMRAAGLDSVPVNSFSWYDHVLDTTVLVGALPSRFDAVRPSGDLLGGCDAATYFTMARGTQDVPPLEMTKWFDTNYHYLVPEISPGTVFGLYAEKPLTELAEAQALGIEGRPVVVGPFTFLSLAKAEQGSAQGFAPLDRLDDLAEVYVELLAVLADAGATWVQFDEPAAVRDLAPSEQEALRRTYQRLGEVSRRPRLLVSTYFADPVEGMPALAGTPVEAIGIDVVRGPRIESLTAVPGLREKTLVLGAVDGRNVWRTDLREATSVLVPFLGLAADVAISASCSLLHVPYDLDVEEDLDPSLHAILAFADQKLAEVVTLQRALEGETDAVAGALAASDEAVRVRRAMPQLVDDRVRRRLGSVTDADRRRQAHHERGLAQAGRLRLPTLPTTTIGSFPQTAAVRRARAEHRAGKLDPAAYEERMRREIADVVALQERIGLDVLVHGEPERNDMVQYFAEQLAGYASTQLGWVQSYGSRCVRPPILYGDVHRPEPMTVRWATYAQGLTGKPVKGMLTGPVTMLAWSFIRDDQPRAVTADQVALALRDEVADLERAGLAIIQVDEPALRELLPLRSADQKSYLHWSVAAFRLATSGVSASTQIHTHLCYSEFGEIMEAVEGLDADVTSIEAARSSMELLGDVAAGTFTGALGPGVYDIHSPRVPEVEEFAQLIAAARRLLPGVRLWVNPDCGLKTRSYDAVEPALTRMVDAAHRARTER